MTTTENWNSPGQKSVILFYPCANVNSRWQLCISKADQKRHLWLLSLLLDRWVFTSFVAWTKFVNVKAMVDTRSTKKNKPNIWTTKKTHQTIHSCESACAFLRRPLSFSWNPCAAHSYAVAIKYARWQIQARGMLGTQAPCSCSTFLCAQHTSHSLAHYKQWTHL